MLCEEVRQEVTGSFFIIGVLGLIRVPQLPVTAYKLCVFNRWTAGIGSFNETVRLIAPDQTTVMRQSNVKFQLQDPAHHATNVSFFGNVEFKDAGIHWVEVIVDDVMKLRYPLPVVVVPPQPGNPNQPGPGAPAVE